MMRKNTKNCVAYLLKPYKINQRSDSMRGNFWKRLLSVILVVAMLSAYAVPANAADDTPTVSFKQVDNSAVSAKLPLRDPVKPLEEENVYADTDVVRVSIVLEKPGTIEAGFSPIRIAGNNAAMAYRDKLENEQQSVVGKIENVIQKDLDVVWNLTLAANIISANVEFGKIESIKKVAGIKDVVLETRYSPDVVSTGGVDPNMATSSAQIGSSAVWAAGYTGAGSKIAVIDTGADIYHEAFDADAFEFSIGQLGREVDLMDASDIGAVLGELHAYESRVSAEDLYVNSKIPFGFNYVDGDLDIVHVNDSMGEHGSHVSGIATANTYIQNNEGTFSRALDTTCVQGVAPDAQLMVMKVFGKNGGAYDSDYMAAIEDAVILGADSVNLSLGSGNPGMSRVSSTYRDLMESLVKSGVVVVMSAGNSGYWAETAENGIPYLYLDDVSMQTNGSPGSYTNAFTVASVDNDGYIVDTYFTVEDYNITYTESPGYSNKPMKTLAGEWEYVLVDGIGLLSEFEEVGAENLTGKIVMCYRGETSFIEKATNAVSMGAAGVVIINNAEGFLYMDLSSYGYSTPVVSMLQANGEFLKMISTEHTTQNGLTYWTGTLDISDKAIADQYNSEYYTMSSFSSWGVPGSLELKPEITAPGGSIYSVAGAIHDGSFSDHASYELMSGTSMAAPQVTGMAALMAQYVREAGLVQRTGLDERTLAQSLLMSTAVPLRDGNSGGNYYPVIQQGAGLGNVGKAMAADSYIIMGSNATDSWADGKVKAELGDDPSKTGVYSFSFTVHNLTGEDKNLKLSADVFTQDAFMDGNGNLLMDTWTANLTPSVSWSVNGKGVRRDTTALDGMDFNGDGAVDELDGWHLLDYAIGQNVNVINKDKADMNGDGAINSYDAYLFLAAYNEGHVDLTAYGSADVTVTITLSDADKARLADYENGAYIEAYIYAETLSSDEGVAGTVHSIPMLAFYGNWADPSMFDKGSYMEYVYGLETRAPYLYQSAFSQDYTNSLYVKYAGLEGEYVYGGNPFVFDSEYRPERNAINAARGDVISSVGFTSIRNAADSILYVANAQTGEFYTMRSLGPVDSAFYYTNGGYWSNVHAFASTYFDFTGIPEGTALEVGLALIPEYYIDDEGNIDWDTLAGEGLSLCMPMVVDNTAPTVKDVAIDAENDILTVSAVDNQYIAYAALFNSTGDYMYVNTNGPAYDLAPGETVQVMLNLAEVNGSSFLLQVYDYAMNVTTYEITTQIGEVTDTVEGIEISKTQLVMNKGTTQKLTASVLPVYASNRNVIWTTSDASVVSVDGAGNLTANAAGIATITAAAEADETITATCTVEVIEISSKMNAVVWDEMGAIWFSEFVSDDLPSYTKLSPDVQPQDYFTCAAVADDGTLYASTLNTSLGSGSLYTVDPTTYEATLLAGLNVQGTDVFFSDMTYAPAMFGTGVLLGTYGPYVIVVDPATGECLGIVDELDSDLVGIACCGSSLKDNDGTLVYQDAVYLIENDGTVIEEVYYGYDGQVVPYYSYFYDTRISKETGISVGDAWYFNSAHYDGDYLYWSAFEPGVVNAVTLYAIDMDNTGNVYNMGQFADDVWPVGGLHQLNAGYSANKVLDEETLAGLVGRDLTPAEIQLVPRTIPVEKAKAGGSLNAVAGTSVETVSPMSDAKADCNDGKVTVEITAKDLQGNGVFSHNGVVNVTYDPQALTLDAVEGRAEYMSFKHSEDSVTIGYVDLVGIAADETVAVLTFSLNREEETSVTVEHKEVNEDAMMSYTETLALDAANLHNLVFMEFDVASDYSSANAIYWCENCGNILYYAADVTFQMTKEPTCAEVGEGEYTISHGENSAIYVVEMPTIAHNYENGFCTECGQSEDVMYSGTCGENLRWYLTKDGTLTISGTGDMYDYDLREAAPWHSYYDSISSIVVEEGVTSIGAHAFAMCMRTGSQFHIPASVSKIGPAAFRHMTCLEEFVLAEGNTAFRVVDNALLSADGTQLIAYPAQLTGVYTVPNTVTTIWEFAFANSNVNKLILPDSVKVLKDNSLYNLWQAKEVVLGNGIETIGVEFLTATTLDRLYLPASVRDIAEGAFMGAQLNAIEVDENNRYYRVVDGVLYSADMTLLHTYPVRLEQSSIAIPDTVTTIANYAFADCEHVSNIRFRGDAPAIGEDTFAHAKIVATYPAGNDTWTEAVRQDYGGELYWYADSEPLTIVIQPESQRVAESIMAVFEAYAAGDMPSYRWQYRMSESEEWTDFWNEKHRYGVGATAENDGMQLRCRVTDANGNQVYTDVVTLTVSYPRLENSLNAGYTLDDLVLGEDGIYRTPDGRTVYIAVNNIEDGGIRDWLGGFTLYDYVEAYGEDFFDMTYWDELLALMDEGGYVVLTEQSLQYLITLVTGNPAWGETVNQVPNYLFYDREAPEQPEQPEEPEKPGITITSQPVDYVGMVGDMATFTVEAEGEDLQYQWYYSSDNGATWLKSSGTGSTLNMEFKAYRVNYQYYCQITDAAGNTMNSNTVRLLAEQVELKILTQPVSYVGAVNDEVAFTVEATGNGLVYEWFYSEDGGNVWNKSYSPGYETNVLAPVLRTHRDGNMYYCVITDVFGNSVTSDVVSMSVKASDVVIVKQPKSNVNCILSQLYQFTVEATGENLTYRWEFSDDGGNTWQESWNDGYNTPVLNVRMNANRDGNQYRCVVTSGLKTVAISDPAVLDLQDPSVEIISNSGNVYVVAGEMATFTVTAVGDDLTYLWYRSDDDGATWYQTYLDGYNTDTLSFKATTQRAVKYLCKITDGSGKSVWSAPVKLRILSGELAILEQPVSVTCRLGETAKFTVKAQGDSLKYRWYASADGGETWTMSYLDGCDTAEFSFVVNASRAAKVYKCVITDVAGNTVQTDVVSVTVE